MSTKPCGNCEKTVYINEKIDADGRWYHRACFKCMAPGCNTSLTLRSFQMAALDDSVLDPITKRPRKVLVCKDHVPMPKHSLNTDHLSFKHTTSAPKPSIPGLHRSMMGSRGADNKAGVVGHDGEKTTSPRSLDQGSHANILKDLRAAHEKDEKKHDKEEKEGDHSTKDSTHGDDYDDSMNKERSEVHSMETTTLPEVSDPVTASHVSAAAALDPTKDDDSFRNIPVRHSDYEHKDGYATKEDAAEWDEHEETENHEQEHTLPLKDSAEQDEKPSGNLAFNSKLMDQKHGRNMGKDTEADDKVVDDDEWDAAPTDDFSRETVAGM